MYIKKPYEMLWQLNKHRINIERVYIPLEYQMAFFFLKLLFKFNEKTDPIITSK